MDNIPVEFAVANHEDVTLAGLGLLDPERVRRARLRGVVDGTMRPVLPGSVLDHLGLNPGRTVDPPRVAGGCSIGLLGREGVYTVSRGIDPEAVILGRIVLEDLDLIVDPDARSIRLRDPNTIISEL